MFLRKSDIFLTIDVFKKKKKICRHKNFLNMFFTGIGYEEESRKDPKAGAGGSVRSCALIRMKNKNIKNEKKQKKSDGGF